MKRVLKLKTYLGEADCEVVAHYWPGRPGRWYMPNGDPGYPDDPAELEVVSVTIGGTPYELNYAEREELETRLMAADELYDGPDYDEDAGKEFV